MYPGEGWVSGGGMKRYKHVYKMQHLKTQVKQASKKECSTRYKTYPTAKNNNNDTNR